MKRLTSLTFLISDKLRIKAMFPGQPAENSEKLRVGDIIMAANGVSLMAKTSRDAINVLRDQPTRVVLTVKRDPSSIPPALLRRGSFSKNLDPNEVLSAIHSKFDEDAPGNETSSRAHNDPHEHHKPLASSSQSNSYPKRSNDVISQDRNEPYEERDSINWGNMDQEAASQDENRTNVGIYGDEGTSLDRSGTDGGSSDLVENSSLRRSSNQVGNSTSELSNPRAFKPRTETTEMLGSMPLVTTDQSFVSGIKLREGISSYSMSDDQIFDSDYISEKTFVCEESKRMPTSQMDEDVSYPQHGETMNTQTFVDGEDYNKERRNVSVRPFQKEKKERLAPEEEVSITLRSHQKPIVRKLESVTRRIFCQNSL